MPARQGPFVDDWNTGDTLPGQSARRKEEERERERLCPNHCRVQSKRLVWPPPPPSMDAIDPEPLEWPARFALAVIRAPKLIAPSLAGSRQQAAGGGRHTCAASLILLAVRLSRESNLSASSSAISSDWPKCGGRWEPPSGPKTKGLASVAGCWRLDSSKSCVRNRVAQMALCKQFASIYLRER